MKQNIKGKTELIFLFVLFLGFIFLYLWKTSSMIIHPPRFHGPVTPEVFGLEYEEVEFLTEDSITIRAWFVKNRHSRSTIILLHGFAVDKSDLLDIALLLSKNNFSVLLIDFRGHGESQGTHCSLGYFEKLDLRAAVNFLKERKEKKIGVMGFSMGGTVALLEASLNPDILSVISDSGYLSFRSAVRDFARAYYHSPEYPFIPPIVWAAGKRLGIKPKNLDLSRYVNRISPRPIFIIHSRDDREIKLINALKTYEYAKEPKELWIVEEAGHLGAHAAEGKYYESKVISFFKKHL